MGVRVMETAILMLAFFVAFMLGAALVDLWRNW